MKLAKMLPIYKSEDNYYNSDIKHITHVAIKWQLCSFQSVKGPTKLRELADLALNAVLILKETSLYAEVDSQTTVSTILDILAHHNKLRRRKEDVSIKHL